MLINNAKNIQKGRLLKVKTKIWIEDNCQSKDYKRIFIMSDIHNQYKSYCALRDKLGFSRGDLIIIDGDIVDRGEENADPLGICSEIRFEENREYDVIMLRGNHEQWLAEAIIRYCETGIKEYSYNSLEILAKELSKEELLGYANWMLELPLGLEMQVRGFRRKFKIAHASTLDFSSEEESLMGSYNFYLEGLKDRKYTSIVGHTITSMERYYFEEFSPEEEKEDTDIFRIGNKMWFIDCGNGYRDEPDFPGKLGCIELLNAGKVKEHYI